MRDKVEKKLAEDIRKKLALSLNNLGFKRTKPTFYTKLHQDRIDFVHLHKFTFGLCFRVHIGTRLLSDSFDAIALNGIDSDSFRTKYNFSFEPTEESGSHCVNQMTRFIQIEGSNWFNQTKALSKLDTLDNNSELVSNSYKPLRIKKPN